ncbi:MAG TPA: serine hydrolase domain-containing protein [Acidimicrobiales bacterium]|nr:serine hydrolase domain-containing protein [Acidimicrobiales bacterium]
MSTNLNPRPIHRQAQWVAAALAAGLLVVASACSSSGQAASTNNTIESTSAVAPTSVAPTTTVPQPDPALRPMLEGILHSHHDAGEFVGGRIALREPDGAITEAVIGTKTLDPSSGTVDLDTPWNVGSITKTFVAVIVLQLADEGRVDLDAPIAPYFPQMKDADRITTRMLLQHTSGLNDYSYQPAVVNDQHRVWTPDELIAVAQAAGPVGEPGGAFHYSNTNYIVLGELIRKVTGHSWDDEVHTRIVEPLGLTHTGVVGSDMAPGFVPANGSFVDATHSEDPSLGGSAGAMQSTGRDLLTFITAIEDGTLLSPESQQAMQTFVPGEDYSQFGITHSYGLGFEKYANDTITVEGHMGTGAAHEAFVGFDPARGTAVAVTLNTNNPGPQAFMAVEALTGAAS